MGDFSSERSSRSADNRINDMISKNDSSKHFDNEENQKKTESSNAETKISIDKNLNDNNVVEKDEQQKPPTRVVRRRGRGNFGTRLLDTVFDDNYVPASATTRTATSTGLDPSVNRFRSSYKSSKKKRKRSSSSSSSSS